VLLIQSDTARKQVSKENFLLIFSLIMVFAKSWEDFEIAAEAMLLENPDKCRYSMKYTHNKQKLVIKVTNNLKVNLRKNR
jgi:disulfide bond formation protein DsbB